MQSKELFQFALDNAIGIVIIFNESGEIVYANRAAEQKLEYGDALCGRSVAEIFPGEFKIEEGCFVMECEIGGEAKSIMAYRKNRTCFPMKIKFQMYEQLEGVLGEADSYKGRHMYICTAYDVSNENFLEKKVSQVGHEAEVAQKVKSEFVANVTHELRTPVNGILGNAQALINKEDDEEKLRLLYLVERGCRDMHSIINNILDFSKLEAGKFILEPRRFQFRNMMDYVKSNHINRIIEKGLEFSVTVPNSIPEYIVGDELRIVQILNNLISNAYKFTAVGEIHVEVVKTEQAGNRMQLFFMVIDTGIGIDKAAQDKLFQSFYQVDASISRKYGGTGLGLNICKQLIELMGGNIHVESTVGKGTIFTFDIWVEIAEEDKSDAEESTEQEYNAEFIEKDMLGKLQSLSTNSVGEKIWKYGEPENKEEIEKKMSKLILCLEMENWEKAEMFAETVKQLVEEAPREVKSHALRLKMAIQKGDYEKATAAFELLQKMV